MSATPLLSISCITYNHEPFLRECFEGFLIQKTNFSFEILIHDDASTDGTRKIIEEYTAKYPDLFFPFYQEHNQYSKGVRCMMVRFNFPRARGKYIALCEGDDYWTDPYKLQKQVDFLENNKNFSICFTDYKVFEQNSKYFYFPELIKKYRNQSVFSRNQLILTNFIPTPTVMFKHRKDVFTKLDLNLYPGDWFLHILNSEYGLIKFLPFESAVYRKHDGGVCSSSSPIDNNKKYIKSIRIFRKIYSKNYYVQFLFSLVILKIRIQNSIYKFL